MKMKIAIGVPTGGTMKSKTAFSLMETIRQNDLDIFPIFQYGSYVCENRERIVDIAGMNLCSHILFVDDDMCFGSDLLPRLLAHDKDIVGVPYNFRKMPRETVIKFFDEKGETVNSLPEMSTELFKVAGIGTGLALIKMEVFDAIDTPYFPIERDKEGNMILTEDIGFCEKARANGFDVWLDPTIEGKHIGLFEF